MTALLPPSGSLPHAEPSRVSRPFWDGCAVSELRYQRCSICGSPSFPPAELCRTCHRPALMWELSAGEGSIYSWSIVWRGAAPVFVVPYAVAIVQLDEGYQMLSNIVGCEDTEVRSGLRVHVEFHSPDADFVLPCFSPTER